MATKPEHTVVADLQKKNLAAALKLAQLSIENSQRIMQLQVDVARDIFDEGVTSAKSLAQVNSPQDAMELRSRYAQQTAEKMFACSRTVAEITADMQAEMGKMLSDQLNSSGQEMFGAMQDMLHGMPLNSRAAAEALQHTFETARKTLEQVSKASTEAFSAFVQMPGSKN
ncbi:MAG: phbP [Proteobacteria bacterium]|nr:phbP [Pseudomonadota bacterium]